jgi:hypothetical protein
MDFSNRIREYETELQRLVGELVTEWPAYISAAQSKLGGLWDQSDYPSVNELPHLFGINVSIEPLNDPDDFRVQLPDDFMDQLKQNFAKTQEENQKEAIKSLWQRIAVVLSKIAERLAEPDKIFRDATIESAGELCVILDEMNIFKDEALNSISMEIKDKICSWQPDHLRKHKGLRQKVYEDTNEILAKVKAVK